MSRLPIRDGGWDEETGHGPVHQAPLFWGGLYLWGAQASSHKRKRRPLMHTHTQTANTHVWQLTCAIAPMPFCHSQNSLHNNSCGPSFKQIYFMYIFMEILFYWQGTDRKFGKFARIFTARPPACCQQLVRFLHKYYPMSNLHINTECVQYRIGCTVWPVNNMLINWGNNMLNIFCLKLCFA